MCFKRMILGVRDTNNIFDEYFKVKYGFIQTFLFISSARARKRKHRTLPRNNPNVS